MKKPVEEMTREELIELVKKNERIIREVKQHLREMLTGNTFKETE